MTAKASYDRTIWDEYFRLNYRKAVKGRFLRTWPGRFAIGYRRQFGRFGRNGGVWVRYNPLNHTHREAKREWNLWRAKWFPKRVPVDE